MNRNEAKSKSILKETVITKQKQNTKNFWTVFIVSEKAI